MNSRDVIRRLKKNGWQLIRTRGSHHIFRHPDRPDARVVVPHPRKDLARGTLRSIFKAAGWTER